MHPGRYVAKRILAVDKDPAEIKKPGLPIPGGMTKRYLVIFSARRGRRSFQKRHIVAKQRTKEIEASSNFIKTILE